MKRHAPRAFTLIELVVVLFVIVLLASLVVSIASLVNRNSALRLAATQINELSRACEDYKLDHGAYPENTASDRLDPRKDTDPNDALYQDSSRYFYSCLSGDYQPEALPDYQAEPGNKGYHIFKPNELAVQRTADGTISGVRFIKDPFGYPYGYSTIGAVAENEYREQLQANPNAPRPDAAKGYNATFDLWSTAGKTRATDAGAWEKSWGK